MTIEFNGHFLFSNHFLGNIPTKKEGVCMESKLIQEIRLKHQMNRLLEQIDYQVENPMNAHKKSALCAGTAFIT